MGIRHCFAPAQLDAADRSKSNADHPARQHGKQHRSRSFENPLFPGRPSCHHVVVTVIFPPLLPHAAPSIMPARAGPTRHGLDRLVAASVWSEMPAWSGVRVERATGEDGLVGQRPWQQPRLSRLGGWLGKIQRVFPSGVGCPHGGDDGRQGRMQRPILGSISPFLRAASKPIGETDQPRF